MSANNFDFRFEGEQLAPSTISIFSLAPFVQSFCEAVEAEGKKRGILVNTSDNNIHLLKISEGSLVLNCAGSSENVMSLVSSVVSAFSMQYPGIPSSKTIEFIKQSKIISATYNCKVSLYAPSISSESIILTTDKDYEIPSFEAATFHEESRIYGTLISIGGKNNSTAHIQNLAGDIISCQISQDLAKKIAPELYGEVLRLSGVAHYDYDEEWEFRDFTIHEYSKMESTSILEAVEAIKPFLVDKYNEIDDMEEHFRSMRN